MRTSTGNVVRREGLLLPEKVPSSDKVQKRVRIARQVDANLKWLADRTKRSFDETLEDLVGPSAAAARAEWEAFDKSERNKKK